MRIGGGGGWGGVVMTHCICATYREGGGVRVY